MEGHHNWTQSDHGYITFEAVRLSASCQFEICSDGVCNSSGSEYDFSGHLLYRTFKKEALQEGYTAVVA